MPQKRLTKKFPGPHNENNENPSVSTYEKTNTSEKQLKQINEEPVKKSEYIDAYHHKGNHHDRKLKDYIFEFIMLFLAITGGFFTENMRENMEERHKEKQYIVSLIRDIKEDTTKIHSLILSNQRQMTGIDSILHLLENSGPTTKIRELYELTFKYLNNYNGFTPRDITITQLKNSGGLRLIENNSVADSIVVYYSTIEYYHDLNVHMNYKYVDDTYKMELEFFDFSPFRNKNKSFSPIDPDKMKELYNRSIGFNSSIGWDNRWLSEVYYQGTSLLKYLKKEYNINE